MVPRWIFPRSRRQIQYADAKPGAETEEEGYGEEDQDFVSVAVGAEFLGAGPARDDDAEKEEKDGEEGDGSVKGAAVKLYVSGSVPLGGVEGVETQDDKRDDEDKRDDDERVQAFEHQTNGGVPARAGLRRAEDALGEDEVHNEENYDAYGDEDGGRDGNGDVGGAGGPDNAHNAGNHAGHAEAEHGAGHKEFVAAAAVALEDSHVGDGAEEEDEEEDGGDGDVEGDGGLAAEAGGGGPIGRP